MRFLFDTPSAWETLRTRKSVPETLGPSMTVIILFVLSRKEKLLEDKETHERKEARTVCRRWEALQLDTRIFSPRTKKRGSNPGKKGECG